MSEYWKSTPKFWCKHCKIFVRDTKLETANHNASPKHQGNLKRFLRDLQRNHDKDEKDKERAKLEVARLNDIVPGKRSQVKSSLENGGQLQSHYSTSRVTNKSIVSESQRKQNLAQLAEMGISIPSELRPDMAMPGEWEVISEHVIDPNKVEENQKKTLSGSQKRAADVGQEEDEMEKEFVSKKKKSHWRLAEEDNDKELNALLTTATQFKKQDIKSEITTEIPICNTKICQKKEQDDHVSIKSEPGDDSKILPQLLNKEIPERSEPTNNIFFAKRKAKNIR
ncbi:hypothetical protein EPUL_004816, partial [Erysiphe pulchra]